MGETEKRKDYEARWDLDNIKYLVLEAPNEYIVFIDDTLVIDWLTSDEYDKRGHADTSKFNGILSKSAEIESIPNDHLKESLRINFKRMIGEAIARGLDGDYDNAGEMLEKAREYILSRNFEAGRGWHLVSSLCTTLVIVIFGFILWSFRNTFISLLGNTGFFVLLSTCGGCVGAMLSIYQRIGNVNFDSAAGKRPLLLEGVLRIIVSGGIPGMLAALFIDLGLIFPVFLNNKHLAMVTFAVVAGVSERWIPSIITQLTAKNATAGLTNKGGNVGEEAYSSNLQSR